MEWAECQKCNVGFLLPLSDYGPEGAAVKYKAWACINPKCGFVIRVDKGNVTFSSSLSKTDGKH